MILPLDGARLCKPIDQDRRQLCKVTEEGKMVNHESMKEMVLILGNKIMLNFSFEVLSYSR